jgi:arginyl-tRNA synthetase
MFTEKIMRHAIETIVADAIAAAVHSGELALSSVPETAVERPHDPSHGDWACTVALRLAKELSCNPREIAEVIAAHIRGATTLIASVEVAGPGFINLRLSNAALQQVIRDAREQGARFAHSDVGEGRTVNIEFISANPTGPMHVGHGRWAALGNALCNVCEHAGWKVTREFYINDAGNQMELFGASVLYRYFELCGVPATFPEGGYGGSYVIDIAQCILDEDGRKWCGGVSDSDLGSDSDPERATYFRERGYTLMLAHMRELCERIGVPFDVWFSERTLYERGGGDGASNGASAAGGAIDDQEGAAAGTPSPIESLLATLAEKGYLYEKDGATWFRTTDFSDDKDRVLIKADGSYTYFAPDIAYHLSKFNRGSELLIDIWGADHHGYIPRMKSACEALGHAGKLEVVLGQLVNLFRDGEAVRMSKRTGEMVTFEELIDEVGADATKYLMLNRSTDQPLDFDIEVAKKQDASNPVYYVQYAHARICSLLRRAGGTGVSDAAEADVSDVIEANGQPRIADLLGLDAADLSLLTDPAELELARIFSQFAEVVEGAARDLAPFRLTRYAEELATGFHSFYTRCQVLGNDEELTHARLYLADAARSVLALVLTLLGVTAPERM